MDMYNPIMYIEIQNLFQTAYEYVTMIAYRQNACTLGREKGGFTLLKGKLDYYTVKDQFLP